MKKLLVILLLFFVVGCDGEVKKEQKENVKYWEGFELISSNEDHSVMFVNKKTNQARLCYVHTFDNGNLEYECATDYNLGRY